MNTEHYMARMLPVPRPRPTQVPASNPKGHNVNASPEADAAIKLVAEAAWAEGYLAALNDIPWDDTTPNPYRDQS